MKIKPYNIDLEKAHTVLQAVSYEGNYTTGMITIFIKEKWEYELTLEETQQFYEDAKVLLNVDNAGHYRKRYTRGYRYI